MPETKDKFEGWGILELMGHRRLAGKLSEQVIAGGNFIRIDIPGEKLGQLTTQFYSPNAVYCISPTSQEVAQSVSKANLVEIVHPWELPPQLPPAKSWVAGEPEPEE